MHPLAPFPFPLEAFREGGRTMAGLSVGYQREDAFNMAEQPGVAVITTSREQPVQQVNPFSHRSRGPYRLSLSSP